MSKTDHILEKLFTGEKEFDDRLRKAFELGIRHGQAADREAVQRSARVDQTTRMLITVMRRQNIDLEQAMALFELSRDDREMYRRIIGSRKTKNR